MAEGAVISHLVNMLTEFLKDGISPIWRVREQVDPLCVELKAMLCFLKDMDGKEGKNASVKNWLTSVRNVAYEVEDLIEGFMIEGQRHAPFRATVIYSSYGKQIAEITSKISHLVELRKRYVSHVSNPRKDQGGTSSDVGLTWRRTSSFLNDDPIVGFQQHTCNLMKVLLSSEQKLHTIVITGMGGIGKTTLASVLYNDAHNVEVGQRSRLQLGNHPKEFASYREPQKPFDFFAWVTAGPDPDIPTLLRIILAQGGSHSSHSVGFIKGIPSGRYLSNRLLEFLRDKKYLIVLDDVWSPDVCSLLMQALPDRENGSRIILTSRQKDLPRSIIYSSFVYELKALNEEDSWQLFLSKAFPQSNQQHGGECPQELEDLGRELSKRCYGLPLALIVLGGLVSRKVKHPAVLIELLESLNWVSTEDGQECLHILALSYWDLSYHVKPCFLYLGAFRPDSEISASKLIKVWAGDGLVSKKERRTNEEVGFEYLDELIQRCIVQVAIRGPDNRVKRIRVHGLLSELAMSEANESCFLHVSRECHAKMLAPGNFHRRLAFHSETIDFPIENCSDKLRALLVFPKFEASKKITFGRHVTKVSPLYKMVARLLDLPLRSQPKAMKYIRVLEIEGVYLKDENHPEFLEDNMLHLRYLGLRDTKLRGFPCQKCNLQCLQTLDIRGTSLKLPNHLWTSKTLEHLYLNSVPPPSISSLTSLQTLVGATCLEGTARDLSSLTNIRYLKLELMEISCGDELINSLRDLSNLISLKLYGSKIPQGVIGATRNHQRLFKLNLKGKLQPNVLPSFEEFSRYLTQLTLSGASLKQEPMSTLKQLGSLRVLKLKDGAYVRSEIICSSGGFSQLQYLKLSRLHFLSFFHVESSAFPNLTRLSIHGCLTLPNQMIVGLEELTKLQVLKLKDRACTGMISAIAEFCQSNNVFLRMHNSIGTKTPIQTHPNQITYQKRQ